MQCPCGAETTHSERELKMAKTVSEWAQKEVDCEFGYLEEDRCPSCGRIRRKVFDQDRAMIASFG